MVSYPQKSPWCDRVFGKLGCWLDSSGDHSSFIVDGVRKVAGALRDAFCMWPYVFSRRNPLDLGPTAGGTERAMLATFSLAVLNFVFLMFNSSVMLLAGLTEAMSVYQVLGILTCQVCVLFFDARASVASGGDGRVHGYTRSLMMLAINYLEVIFWFAAWYKILENQFHIRESYLALWPLRQSWSVMTSFMEPVAKPLCGFAEGLVWVQSFVGFFMLVVAIAMVVQQMPQRGTYDTLEQRIEKRSRY
jgi:hypothetical protein